MAFLPEGIPGFPIPLNLANGLLFLIERTRTPTRSSSNIRLSPGLIPRTRRISCGTVIWPLLVTRARFFTLAPRFLLYHRVPYLCRFDCPGDVRRARFSIEFKRGHGLVGSDAAGDDFSAEIVFAFDGRTGEASKHGQLANVRERVSHGALE